METDIFTGLGTIFLIVLGFFAAGGLFFSIERFIEFRRSDRESQVSEAGRSVESPEAYGPNECYRDCLNAVSPFTGGQQPSCAEACGLST
jgi:hypothetical protein